MTDHELIETVATHLEWVECRWFGDVFAGVPKGTNTRKLYLPSSSTNDDGIYRTATPPWLTSLDAAQEVVDTLDDVQMSRWLGHLIRTVFPQLSNDDDMKLQEVNAMLMRDVINATARQRIEAFVQVIESEAGIHHQ